jgi:hypothetical protein
MVHPSWHLSCLTMMDLSPLPSGLWIYLFPSTFSEPWNCQLIIFLYVVTLSHLLKYFLGSSTSRPAASHSLLCQVSKMEICISHLHCLIYFCLVLPHLPLTPPLSMVTNTLPDSTPWLSVLRGQQYSTLVWLLLIYPFSDITLLQFLCLFSVSFASSCF